MYKQGRSGCFPFCSTFSDFDEIMFGVKFFVLSTKINEESKLYPIFRRAFSNILEGMTYRILSGGEPSDLQFSPIPFTSFLLWLYPSIYFASLQLLSMVG